MLTLDSVTVDTTGWRAHESGPARRSWYAGDESVLFRLLDRPSPENTIEGWRERAAIETTAGGGTCLSFDPVVLDGCTAFRGLFKFPASRCVPGVAANSLAVYIVGMIAVPLGASHLLINTEAMERGTTGAREAAFGLTQPRPTGAPRPLARGEDLFDRVRASLAQKLPSDEPEADSLVPAHPLSLIRARQRAIVASIRFGAELEALAMRSG